MIVPYIYTGPSSCAYHSGSTVFGGVVTRGNLVILIEGMYPLHYQSALSSYPFVDSSMWTYTADIDVRYNGSILYSSHLETYERQTTSIYAPQGSQVKMRIKVNPYNRTYIYLPDAPYPQDFTAIQSASLSTYECSASGILDDVKNTVSARARIATNEFTVGSTAAGNPWHRYVSPIGYVSAVISSGFRWRYGERYSSYHHHSSDSAFPTAATEIAGLAAQHFTFPTSTYPVYKPKLGNYTQYATGRQDWYGFYNIVDKGERTANVFGSAFHTLNASGSHKGFFGPDVSSCVISDPNAPLFLETNNNYYSSTPISAGVGSARVRMLVP